MCYRKSMKRLSTVTGLFTIMLAASAAYAEAPKAGAQPAPAPAAKPSAKPAATTPTSSTKKSKPRRHLLSPEEEKRIADLQKEAATFAELLTADSDNNPNRRAGSSMGGLAPLASGVGDNSPAPGRGATAKVCATQPCPTTVAPVSPVGTTSCTVRGIGNTLIDVPALRTKILGTYMYQVRHCTAVKAPNKQIASKTTLAFTVSATGRAFDITATSDNQTLADCIGKLAKNWRFAPASSDDQAAHRVEVTLETKP